jgi:putative membrane protein
MKQIAGIWIGLITLVLIQGCAGNQHPSNYNDKPLVDDKGLAFLNTGTETGLTMIKISGLALSNSKNQLVMQFAKKINGDNMKLVADLKKLKNDSFVTSEDSISDTHQVMISRLEKMHGIPFDKACLKEIVKEQQQLISLFEDASHNSNANVADFAKVKLPILRARVESEKTLESVLK